jgi:hypothetical protein
LGERITEKVSFPFLYIYYIIYLIDLQILMMEFFRVKKFDCRWKVARYFSTSSHNVYASPLSRTQLSRSPTDDILLRTISTYNSTQ